jgi:hypothetical protein
MARLAHASVMLLAALLAACAEDPVTAPPEEIVGEDAAPPPPPDAMVAMQQPPDGDPCEGAEAVIGTGQREFTPVNDGDTIWLFSGPQGGFHIYIGVHAKGLDPRGVTVEYEERWTDSGQVFGVGSTLVTLPTDLGDGWYERVGILGEVDPEWWTKADRYIRGSDVTLKVKLTDAKGCVIENLGWSVHVNPEKP